MAIPSTREEFKLNCLRRLGFPVIKLELEDDQVQDRIDEAIKFYQRFHFDGNHDSFVSHEITATDIANKYISTGSGIIAVKQVLATPGAYSGSNMFDVRYQLRLQDISNFTGASLSYYNEINSRLTLAEMMFQGEISYRFADHQNRLYLDVDWGTRFRENNYLVFQVAAAIDPEEHTEMWSSDMLQRLATILIKKQWGANTRKYTGVKLPGGIEIDGLAIYTEAVQEEEAIKREIQYSYQRPLGVFIG